MSNTPDDSEKTNTDALTGLYNRRFLDEVLTLEVARAERYRLPLTMLLLDIDRFKQVNEAFGHITGDKVIKSVADFLRSSLRRVDFLFRYGTDEFNIVLPYTNAEGGLQVAYRVLSGIKTMNFRQALAGDSALRFSISVSIGMAEYAAGEETSIFLKHVDETLRSAKKARDDGDDESGVPA